MLTGETLWLWRAWSADRTRICDCGVVRAVDPDRAKAIAWMCIGGPHLAEIDAIEVENLADVYPQSHATTIAAQEALT